MSEKNPSACCSKVKQPKHSTLTIDNIWEKPVVTCSVATKRGCTLASPNILLPSLDISEQDVEV